MATIKHFHPFINQELTNCPIPTINDYLLLACQKFCEKTEVWKYTSPAIDVVEDQQDYEPVLPDGAQIVLSIWINFDGTEIKPGPEPYLHSLSPYQLINNTSRSFEVRGTDSIHLNFKPRRDITAGLTARFVLSPKRGEGNLGGREIPDVIFERWRNEIAAGAKAELMKMKDKSWSNHGQSMIYDNVFDNAIINARSAAAKGYTNRPQMVVMRPAV